MRKEGALRSADLCPFGNRELIYFPAPKPLTARPCSQPCCSRCPAQHSSCRSPAQSTSILLVVHLRPGCCEELLAALAPELCCEEKVRSLGPSTLSGLWWKDVTLQVGENWLRGYPNTLRSPMALGTAPDPPVVPRPLLRAKR